MFGFRPRHRKQHTGGLHPALIVGICLAVAVLLTLIIGNFLKLWLDDDTYQKFTQKEPAEEQPTAAPTLSAKRINAYPFALGQEVDDVIGTPAVSVALNTPEGNLTYNSDVAAYLGYPREEEISLYDTVSELSAFVSYISGVFYPQAFAQDSTDLFYTASVEEASLIREFFRTGGSELLLCGMPLTYENLDRICLYLDNLRAASADNTVGVAVPLSVAKSEKGWEILATLERHCHFLVLDVTAQDVIDTEQIEGGTSPAAEALLTDCSYYLSQYGMRILLDDGQTALLSTLEMKAHPNFQVIKAQGEE